MQETGLPKSYSKYKRVCSFKGDPEIWSRFKEGCLERGVSVCHVLDALMEAWLQGQKAEATVIKPVVVNLHMQHVVKRPRRAQTFDDMLFQTRRKNWPPPCEKADEFIKSKKEVGCLDAKQWIPLQLCWRCFYTGQGVSS